MNRIAQRIAEELNIRESQVSATVELLDEGSTVPFIARYRKEVTGSLDDTQLRQLEERLRYLRELEDRRSTILASIEEQGKLTDELRTAIESADAKNRLEDLYLPYKPKRRTKGQIAREAGLEPLADGLYNDPTQDPQAVARQFISADKGVEDEKAALEGARAILMERFAEDAELLAQLRDYLWKDGFLKVEVISGKETEGAKFQDYFDHREPLKSVPSHRALAILRGRNEGILTFSIVVEDEPEDRRQPHPAESRIAARWNIRHQDRPADAWLAEVVRWTWRVKLSTALETDLIGQIRERAEAEAIDVFANNLKDLLLAAPAGQRPTLGLDPGLRTGVKVAILDGTGAVTGYGAIFPHQPKNQWDQSIEQLARWCREHRIELIAIGNGTASRETEKLVVDLVKRYPDLKLNRIVVSEAGASVYSASEFASRELPELDVTIRGAVSIARRLQDPLAELVKIEPKAIGVGQYQHDVSQVQLARSLDTVVEDCVNGVGVDLNTASVPLLARVAGLNQSIAENIVAHRSSKGVFRSRRQLLEVSRLGERTFEQAAGFLRVVGGDHPLDRSAVHPEAYGLVEQIARHHNREVGTMIGDVNFLRSLKPEAFVSDRFGLPTIRDILAELEKPGRDPRPEFRFASFQEGVETLSDLKPGMILEGAVTNVTNFGAFVDIGVHQDGLVHISALSNQFVKDPREVVKAGDIVKVKVLSVDVPRKRIALTMRMEDKPGDDRPARSNAPRRQNPRSESPASGQSQGAMAGALAQALQSARNRKQLPEPSIRGVNLQVSDPNGSSQRRFSRTQEGPMARSREELFRNGLKQEWDGFLKGIEKEGLRVDRNGFIAQTPHPKALGSALTHPSITTDYSEALLELITPVCASTEELLNSLRKIHTFTQHHLGDELFWAASMPCVLDGDPSVRIAEYGTSNVGLLKHAYRQGLAVRYGRVMQSIAGTHYNFSLTDSFWQQWHQLLESSDSLKDFKSDQYFWLIRNFRRRSWLLMLLFGASPAVDASFVKGRSHPLSALSSDTFVGETATSLRMGDLGYHNNAQSSLNICFNELNTYTNTLYRAIHTPWPAYEKLGLKRDGQVIQLSSNVLQIENEYYSTIRPKRTTFSGEKPVAALRDRGVEYIEVRCLDLDPFSPIGVSAAQVDFLDVFLLNCLLADSPRISDAECGTLDDNYRDVVNYGRDPELRLRQGGNGERVLSVANRLIDELKPLAELLDSWGGEGRYQHALAVQQEKVQHPEALTSAVILSQMRATGMGHREWVMDLSERHQQTLRANPLSSEELAAAEKAAADSLKAQADLEQAEGPSFDVFLAEYVAS